MNECATHVVNGLDGVWELRRDSHGCVVLVSVFLTDLDAGDTVLLDHICCGCDAGVPIDSATP